MKNITTTTLYWTSAPFIAGKKSSNYLTKKQKQLLIAAVNEANKAFMQSCLKDKAVIKNMPIVIFDAKITTDKKSLRPKPIKKK